MPTRDAKLHLLEGIYAASEEEYCSGMFLRELDALLDAARAEEREACIQAAEDESVEEVGPGDEIYNRAIQDAAGAIRARGEGGADEG